MIPASYTTLTAAIFVVGGLMTCFGGYRLFRFVLGLYGFMAGAILASSAFGSGNPWTLIMAIVVGGLVGAIVMVVAYFVAVGLVGAALAATLLNLGWRVVGGEPPTLVVIIGCVIGAGVALRAGRYVVVGQYTDVGDTAINPHRHINRRHAEIAGCWGYEFTHLYRSLALMAKHRERFRWRELVTREYGLEEAGKALTDMEGLRVVKAVIRA